VIPKELIVESKLTSSQIRVANEEGNASSWSTGIAEVALPESFRERNRRATEIAAVQLQQEENRRLTIAHGNVVASEVTEYRRFQLNWEESKMANAHLVPREMAAVTGAVSAPPDTDAGAVVGSKRPLYSTDDAAVKRFKQVSYPSSLPTDARHRQRC
jgi:hypothetical protein